MTVQQRFKKINNEYRPSSSSQKGKDHMTFKNTDI